MPSAARFSRFLDRYTEAATRTTSPTANMKNRSHAVEGHLEHLDRRR
jgi:hypothetical protein